MNDEKYRVLILDDDQALGDLLKEYLQNTNLCHVTHVTEESDFWICLSRSSFDILFLDYKLPDTTGLDILERMGEAGVTIPTVMMTGEGSEHIAVRAIQSGALDYLVKGEYSFSVLPSLIQKAVRLREMQQAMQQYLEQIRYQAMLLDNVRDAVVVWDTDLIITYWNAAAEQLYGPPAAEQIGRSIRDVYLPLFDPPLHLPDLHKAGSQQIEHRICKPGGDRVWISAHITALYAGEDPHTPSGTMNVARDITESKLAQNHLTQAARLSSIGELASSVAHQISNPLTTIIAEAQILSHDLGREHSSVESADAIMQAGWRAQSVISELMKFSQPNQTVQSAVSINQTIESALLLASAHIQSSGVYLDVSLQDDLPSIRGNSSQLTDLWVNLLLLARSAFTGSDDRTIKIRAQRQGPSQILVEFTDNGYPIPTAEYDTIFEPKLIPSGSGRGTGMELSLCREIVRQNRGQISISGDGKVTTFSILFPIEGA